MIIKKWIKTWIATLAILQSLTCSAVSLNTYITYDESQLTTQIRHINAEVEKAGILDKYNITTLLGNYPLHTTLYLSEYPSNAVDDVISTLEELKTKCSRFSSALGELVYSASGYFMWDVKLDSERNGDSNMQYCSDQATLLLSSLRDKNAPIPSWAKNIPSKKRAFERYGSPNVFFELSSHFTLFTKVFNKDTDDGIKVELFKDMQKVIENYTPLYSNLRLHAKQICIGIANQQGQIDEVLHCTPL